MVKKNEYKKVKINKYLRPSVPISLSLPKAHCLQHFSFQKKTKQNKKTYSKERLSFALGELEST